jgi:hypothetical protein
MDTKLVCQTVGVALTLLNIQPQPRSFVFFVGKEPNFPPMDRPQIL